jgi:hypothetical protein
MCPPTRTGGKRRNRTAWAISAVQTFSTWPNSRSTGVARPKIDTATLTRERDSSTSSTTPLKEAKGPSATRMFSPISKRIAAFGRSTPVGDLTFDPVGLEIRDRHRLLVGAEKTGHLGRVLDQVIDLVGEVAFDQHIAGEELSLRVDLAAAAHLDDRFGRNENILELFVQAFLTRLMATCMEEALRKLKVIRLSRIRKAKAAALAVDDVFVESAAKTLAYAVMGNTAALMDVGRLYGVFGVGPTRFLRTAAHESRARQNEA